MIFCVAESARRDPEESHFVWSPEPLASDWAEMVKTPSETSIFFFCFTVEFIFCIWTIILNVTVEGSYSPYNCFPLLGIQLSYWPLWVNFALCNYELIESNFLWNVLLFLVSLPPDFWKAVAFIHGVKLWSQVASRKAEFLSFITFLSPLLVWKSSCVPE